MVKIPLDIRYLEVLYQQGHQFNNDVEFAHWLGQHFGARIVYVQSSPGRRIRAYIEFNQAVTATAFILQYG